MITTSSYKKNEQMLQTVLNHVHDGVLFIDQKGKINVYNKTLAEMYSLKNDISGSNIFTLHGNTAIKRAILRVDSEFGGQYCWEATQCTEESHCPGWGSHFCRCWIVRQDGSAAQKYSSCYQCPQFGNMRKFLEKPKELDLEDKILSVLSTFIEIRNEIWEVILFRDVTAEKRDAVVKLAGATAHELRQPLQIIVGTLSLIRDTLKDNDGIKEYIDIIEKSCYRMNDIIEKIGRAAKYKTQVYSDGSKMFDIDKSSEG